MEAGSGEGPEGVPAGHEVSESPPRPQSDSPSSPLDTVLYSAALGRTWGSCSKAQGFGRNFLHLPPYSLSFLNFPFGPSRYPSEFRPSSLILPSVVLLRVCAHVTHRGRADSGLVLSSF